MSVHDWVTFNAFFLEEVVCVLRYLKRYQVSGGGVVIREPDPSEGEDASSDEGPLAGNDVVELLGRWDDGPAWHWGGGRPNSLGLRVHRRW